jgi:hypothetical protein
MAAPLFDAAVAKVQSIILSYPGSNGASASVFKFQNPQKWQIIRVAAHNKAKGGTQGVSTLDVQVGGVSVLSAAIDLTGTADTFIEGTLAASPTVVAKDSVITVPLTITGGTSPTISDAHVQIDYIPRD